MTRTKYGFSNDAADKIWADHLGNNAFVDHRDACTTCSEAFRKRRAGQAAEDCADGKRIFDEVLEEVYGKIDEVTRHQN